MARLYNKGKHKNKLSSFLLAAKNKNNILIPLTKVGVGFSDGFLNKINNFEIFPFQKPNLVDLGNFKPDVFFKNDIVWEISFDCFSFSPIYRIGRGEVDSERGLSLRFPKFKREREDKDFESSNDVDHVIDLYNRMKNN